MEFNGLSLPSSYSADGGAWEVDASEDPPQPVLQAFGRDVLVNMIFLRQSLLRNELRSIFEPKSSQHPISMGTHGFNKILGRDFSPHQQV